MIEISLPFQVENDQQAWLIHQIMSYNDINYWFNQFSQSKKDKYIKQDWKFLSSILMNKIISNKKNSYTVHIERLKELGFIKHNKSYSTDKSYTMSYQINRNKIIDKVFLYQIIDDKIINNFIENKNNKLIWLRTKATSCDRLENKNNKLIWNDLLKQAETNEALKLWIKINVNDWYFFPKENVCTPIRIHHPLVNLNNDFKDLVRINGEEVERLDIVSAWITIAYILYLKHQGEGSKCSFSNFKESDNIASNKIESKNDLIIHLENGEILNSLPAFPEKPPHYSMSDKQWKVERSIFLCQSDISKQNLFKKALEKDPKFKDFVKWIDKAKSNIKNPLWKRLDEVESYIMRRCVYPRFMENDIIWISEYDGCAVPKSKIEQAKQIFEEVLLKETGGCIKVEIKR